MSNKTVIEGRQEISRLLMGCRTPKTNEDRQRMLDKYAQIASVASAVVKGLTILQSAEFISMSDKITLDNEALYRALNIGAALDELDRLAHWRHPVFDVDHGLMLLERGLRLYKKSSEVDPEAPKLIEIAAVALVTALKASNTLPQTAPPEKASTSMSDDEKSMRATEMFESGWFGQGDAFWKWAKTDEALPYMLEFKKMRTRPDLSQPLVLMGGDEGDDILNMDRLDKLAASIEERFGRTK